MIFVKELGSSAPVPGGGGARRACGGTCCFVRNNGGKSYNRKEKYAQYQEDIEKSIEKGEKLAAELAEYMDKDAECFCHYQRGIWIAKRYTRADRRAQSSFGKLLKNASETPLELMKKIVESMELLERLSIIGSNLAISDVGVGIQFAKAALNGASLNVFINTNLMKTKRLL